MSCFPPFPTRHEPIGNITYYDDDYAGNPTFYPPHELTNGERFLIGVFIVCSPYTFFASILVMCSAMYSNFKRKPQPIILINLSGYDMMVALLVIPLIILQTYQATKQNFAKTSEYLCVLSYVPSIIAGLGIYICIFFLSLDRFIEVNFPTFHVNNFTPLQSGKIMGYTLVLVISFSVFPISSNNFDPEKYCTSYDILPYPFVVASATIPVWGLTTLSLIMSCLALAVVNQQAQQFAVNREKGYLITLEEMAAMGERVSSVRLTLYSVLATVVCCIPISIASPVTLHLSENTCETFQLFGKLVFYFSSIARPLIYSLVSREYNRVYSRMCRTNPCKWKEILSEMYEVQRQGKRATMRLSRVSKKTGVLFQPEHLDALMENKPLKIARKLQMQSYRLPDPGPIPSEALLPYFRLPFSMNPFAKHDHDRDNLAEEEDVESARVEVPKSNSEPIPGEPEEPMPPPHSPILNAESYENQTSAYNILADYLHFENRYRKNILLAVGQTKISELNEHLKVKKKPVSSEGVSNKKSDQSSIDSKGRKSPVELKSTENAGTKRKSILHSGLFSSPEKSMLKRASMKSVVTILDESRKSKLSEGEMSETGQTQK